MNISVTVDTSKLNSQLKAIESEVLESLKLGVREGGNIIVNDARSRVHVKTGNLKRDIQVRDVKVSGKSVSCSVGPSASTPYAVIEEFGGIIKPVKGKFLKFEIGGRTIFTKLVHHPAHPYMRPAFAAKSQAVKDAIVGFLK